MDISGGGLMSGNETKKTAINNGANSKSSRGKNVRAIAKKANLEKKGNNGTRKKKRGKRKEEKTPQFNT